MKKNTIFLILPVLFSLSFLSLSNLALAVTDTEIVINKLPSKEETRILKEKALKELTMEIKTREEFLIKNATIKRTEIEKKISEDKINKKIKLEKQKQEKINTIIKKIFDKIDDQTRKISTVSAKMGLKISSFEKEGRDITEVKKQYIIAKEALDKMLIEILAIKMTIQNQVKTETSKETLRSLVKTTEESMKATAGEYRKVLPLLAKMEGDNSVEKKINETSSN